MRLGRCGTGAGWSSCGAGAGWRSMCIGFPTLAMKEVRVGCSGWMYDDWRGRLYPEGEPKRRWLELYAARFDTVEVNSTFYRLARPRRGRGVDRADAGRSSCSRSRRAAI